MDELEELKAALGRAREQLSAALSEREGLQADLAASRAEEERQRAQLAAANQKEALKAQLREAKALVEQRTARLRELEAALARANDPALTPAGRQNQLLRDQVQKAHAEIVRLRAQLQRTRERGGGN